MAARPRVRTNLRLSARLKAELEEMAQENHRSLNQEICVALERHVKAKEDWRR